MPSTPRQPTADAVRRVLEAMLPDGGAPQTRPVTEGGEHSTWWVGEKHVLRLATDPVMSARLRREVRLRDLVRHHVQVAVPASVATGEWAPGLACTLDKRLPGESAEVRDVTAAGEEDLAGLLAGLRAVPVARTGPVGVPKVPPRSLESLRREAGAAALKLHADGEFEAERLDQLSARAVAQLAPQSGTVLVHHDLKGEHLTVSADGRVRGVLDWADAVVGDAAEDIAGLTIAVGARAAVRSATLAGYGPRSCLRGLWLARCDVLVRLGDRLYGADDSPVGLLRVQAERAWEAILLELVSEG
ncbi:aminoglycoside phosphotransferase family protein [Streptomyces sp. NPDC002790]|uniref:aminoglycoside phosphotransferase family protein n=1 Tax=Streptomyces sp. NPDC002790 TaxID=3154431 RepID=UPI0033245C63